MSSLEKCLFSSLAHFDWIVHFSDIELHELIVCFRDYFLSVASFAIFSHAEGCLFTLFIVSFIVQKILSLIRSPLFIISPQYSGRWVIEELAVVYVEERSTYIFL